MKFSKRALVLFLIIIILFQTLSYAITYDDDKEVIDDWNIFKAEHGIDLSTPYTNIKGLIFNKELFEEKSVIVYGDYTLIAASKNNFKNVDNGYYRNSKGELGEYRFHGENQFGEKVSNNNFPPDADAGTQLSKKNWVYTPWDNLSYARASFVKNYGDTNIPEFNFDAIEASTGFNPTLEDLQMSQQINEGLGFAIDNATFTGNDVITTVDPVYFVAVDNKPTTTRSGQGMMFHNSIYGASSTGAWYQTMVIDRVNDKVKTPVTPVIESISFRGIETDSSVEMIIKVTAKLEDDFAFIGTLKEQEIAQQSNYNRDDIELWKFEVVDDLTGATNTAFGSRVDHNTAEVEFTVLLSNEQYNAMLTPYNEFPVIVNAKAECQFFARDDNGNPISSIGNTIDSSNGEGISGDEEELGFIDFDIAAPTEILDVWNFNISVTENDITDLDYKYVEINGTRLDDVTRDLFLAGGYKFAKLGRDKLYEYKVVYVTTDAIEFFIQSHVLVYDSIPRVNVDINNPSKYNRKVTVGTNTGITSDFLEVNSTISISKFVLTSDKDIYYGTNLAELKEFLLKEEGTVNVEVIVSNEFGSRSYENQMYIGTDYSPDIIAMIWNNNLARQDELDIYCEGASLDGDTITDITYEIFFDDNKDGTATVSVHTGIWSGTTNYTPDKLGFYEIVFKTQEEFGEPTIDAHVTADDRKKHEVTREFFVDNLLPMTKVYTDIEYNFPKLDVAIILDSTLPSADVTYTKSNAVNITNTFRVNSMVANVDVWDTKTYVYSTTASNSRYTGSSYPPNSNTYNSSGYSGTLSLASVSNNDYWVDNGRNVTTTSSRYATGSASTSGDQDSANTYPPSSISYNSGGYSGSLSETSYNYSSDGVYDAEGNWLGYTWSRRKTYGGTVYKSTTTWVSDMRHYNRYTGYYSGTAYKNVKQSYDPTYDTGSGKYIIYYANDVVSNKTDFDNIKAIAPEAKIYVVADDFSKVSGFADSTFIQYRNDQSEIFSSIIDHIKSENTIINELSLLTSETFTMSYTDVDPENDPLIITNPMQYVHDSNYFDNPTGLEPGTYATYLDTQYTSDVKTSFANVGKYSIYRTISDSPIEDPSAGLTSNIAQFDVYVHRIPIADYKMDWVFDNVLGTYETTWVDLSYDLDFEFSDPVNKGIVDRKIKYRRNGGTWIYEIPSNLLPGDYDLEYVVKDNYGADSLIKSQSFTLAAAPPVQLMDADLRAYITSEFDLTSIPSSELIEFFDVESRYPYDTHLAFGIYNNSGSILTPQTTKYYNSSNDVKLGQDIAWSDTQYTIPSTLVDGNYKARVYLIADAMASNFSFMEFDMTVFTPIELVGNLPSLITETPNTITATTSKYVDQVSVTLFRGTGREITLPMGRVDATNWTVDYTPPNTIADGNYDYRFTASVPTSTRKYEYDDGTVELISLNIDAVRIWGDWNHWRGQNDKISGIPLVNNPHRFMSHENIHIEADVIGNPDTVEITMSNGLTTMTYTNSKGHTYDHTEFGFSNVNYPLGMGTADSYTFAQEVVLPLADWTMTYDDMRLNASYSITITATKGATSVSVTVNDIELTGNIHDLIYFQAEQ